MTFRPATDDEITLSVYSDLFKDRHGFRPRSAITVQEAQTYIDNCSDSDIDWEAEAAFDAQIAEEMAAWDRGSSVEKEAHDADFGLEAWQIQASRLPNVREQWILDY